MQLMARHQWHEATERAWLEAFERRHGLDPVHRVQYDLAPAVGVRPASKIAAWRSYDTRQLGPAIFGLVSLLSARAGPGPATFPPAPLPCQQDPRPLSVRQDATGRVPFQGADTLRDST